MKEKCMLRPGSEPTKLPHAGPARLAAAPAPTPLQPAVQQAARPLPGPPPQASAPADLDSTST